MPKRIIGLALAVVAFGLGACNSTNPSSLYGAATPTPAPAVSLTPNPTVTAAIVAVTVANSPLPNQPVSISTPTSTNSFGTAFATQTTNASGQTTFTGLTAAANYCFRTTYTPAGGLAQTQSLCTNLWGTAASPNPDLTFQF